GLTRELLERRGATEVMQLLMNRPGLIDVRVEHFMTSDSFSIPAGSSLRAVLDAFKPNAAGFNVVDADSRLVGYVSYTELYVALQRCSSLDTPVEEFMLKDPPFATPDENAVTATLRLVRNDVEILPVVDDAKNRKLIGTVRPLEVFKETLLLEAACVKTPGAS
ncbi:MAG: CBS domain-containing protein, partial [Bryobacterales bacterium]|nr:CBS domain-containing protein [Bryobacterales bacterium]